MKTKINLILAIGIMIVIAGGAFYGGTVYQKSTTSKVRAAFGSGNSMMRNGAVAGQFARGGQGANGARPVTGQIISSDDKSVTVKMKDGSSKIVLFGNSTAIAKSTAGTKTDLATGTQVMVVGTANSDGSVTATNINIQPAPVQ